MRRIFRGEVVHPTFLAVDYSRFYEQVRSLFHPHVLEELFDKFEDPLDHHSDSAASLCDDNALRHVFRVGVDNHGWGL